MNELNKKSFFEEYKKLIVSHLIISASLSLIGVLVINFLAIDGMAIGILMGIIYAFCASIIYFAISMGLCLFDNNLKYGKIISIGSIIVTVTIILFFAISESTSGDNTIGYISGNYSQYSCEDCGKPADGGRFHLSDRPDEYYCNEHYLEHKQWSDEYEKGYTCRVCHRKFRSGSDNAQSIRRTNMCINCYNNYKSMQGLLDEMPID